MLDSLIRDKLKTVIIKISEDAMLATISLPRGKSIGTQLSSAMLKEHIEEKGVKFGLKLTNIDMLCARLLSGGDAVESMVVAEGLPPKNGTDGSISYAVDFSMTAGELTQSDSIDYRERNYVPTVMPDQLIAETTPPGEATDGKNIYGTVVHGKPGKPAPRLHHDKTIKYDEKQQRYFSLLEGHVIKDGDKLVVSPNLEIDGDISFKTGNVRAVGNLTILGSVKSGFLAQAKGNIKIRGDVEERAKVISAGNVEIAGMIKCGKDDGFVKAIGSILTSNVQNSFLKSHENITVLEYAISSDIECGGEFLLTDKRGDGCIRGCNIEAIRGIKVRVIGSKEGSSNNIVVGWSQKLVDAKTKLTAEKEELEKNLAECYKTLKEKYLPFIKNEKELKKMKPLMRQEITKRIQELKTKIDSFKSELEKINEELVRIETEMQECDDAKILIIEEAYPQCVLAIKDKKIAVMNEKLSASIISMNKNSGKLELERYTQK